MFERSTMPASHGINTDSIMMLALLLLFLGPRPNKTICVITAFFAAITTRITSNLGIMGIVDIVAGREKGRCKGRGLW